MEGSIATGMRRSTLAGVSFNELLLRARDGDQGALEELFQRCRPKLAQNARKHLAGTQPGGARPSDIAQETAERALRKFLAFRGSTEAEWYTWLNRIFHSRVKQSAKYAHQKKRSAAVTFPLDALPAHAAPADQKSPSQTVSRTEEWRRLLTLLFELPDDQREAIRLCYLDELPVAEVAQRMGKTKPSVEGLLQRGLRTLRSRMTEETGAEPRAPTSTEEAMDAASAALVSYLRRRDAGEEMDPAAFVAEHPACADELRSMLHWIERIQELKPPASSA
jgi:RNA polymerase sigma-70 factor, ECF subfamily